MKVSAAWIGVLLIVSVLVYFTVYGYHVYEKFKNPERVVSEEGFVDNSSNSGINITTCPAGSKSFLDTGGRTLCCMGDVTSDQCKGETICSLSEASGNLPTCSAWYESYLLQRGRGRCPRSMPMYFETYDGKVKGCTSGRLNKEGTAPFSPDQKRCVIYPNKMNDEGKVDSCTNYKLLENTVCFPGSNIPHDKELVAVANGWLPALVQCKFGDITQRTAGICQTDDSMVRFMTGLFTLINQWLGTQYTVGNWMAGSKDWPSIEKLDYCSVTKKVKIDRTLDLSNLKGVPVF